MELAQQKIVLVQQTTEIAQQSFELTQQTACKVVRQGVPEVDVEGGRYIYLHESLLVGIDYTF